MSLKISPFDKGIFCLAPAENQEPHPKKPILQGTTNSTNIVHPYFEGFLPASPMILACWSGGSRRDVSFCAPEGSRLGGYHHFLSFLSRHYKQKRKARSPILYLSAAHLIFLKGRSLIPHPRERKTKWKAKRRFTFY